jgi:hypothetical protein
MWLFTTHGFYSVVEHHQIKDRLLIRARKREHLAALFVDDKIKHTPERDYHWRVELWKDEWELVLMRLNDGLNYTNFKGAVFRKEGGTDYEHALHRVWAIMEALQPQDRQRLLYKMDGLPEQGYADELWGDDGSDADLTFQDWFEMKQQAPKTRKRRKKGKKNDQVQDS